MLISYKRGQGSIVLRVKIRNSSVSTGAGLTGLTSASAGLIISTIADNESAATAYTVAGSTIETITTLGTYAAPTATKCRFKEVDATNHKGVYEIQIADARFAVSSAKSVLISISGATNAAECDALVPLTDMDPYDAVRGGMSAFPNVASGSAGAIITAGTGTAQLSVTGGVGQADAAKINGVATSSVTAVNANIGTAQPVGFTGTGGTALVKSDMVDIAGAAVSTSSAQIGVNVVNFGGAAGTFASGRPEVKLGDIAHGGTATTITFERLVGVSTTLNQPCISATGNGTGAGISGIGGTNAAGIQGTGNGAAGPGIYGVSSGGTAGMRLSGSGGSDDIVLTGNKSLSMRTALVGSPSDLGSGATIAGNLIDINLKTTNLPASPAAVGDAMTLAAGAIASATFAAGATIPRCTLVDTLTTYTGNTPQTGDAYARLGAPAGASVSADIAAINAKTVNLPASPAATGDIPTAAQNATAVLTTQMTESYNVDGTAPTLAQAAFVTMQMLTEMSISGTTMTIKKLDGTTTALTLTINDATTPTSVTRSG